MLNMLIPDCQERIFTAIIFHLQQLIDCSFNNRPYQQLSLFNNHTNWLYFNIPLKEICKPNHYPQVVKAVEEMVRISVSIPFTKADGRRWRKLTTFMNAEVPENGNNKGYIAVQMLKQVAKHFIELDHNQHNKAMNFTRFVYEIAQKSKNKYSTRIYKMLSCWKSKGMMTISLKDLKEQMGLESKYLEYTNFKNRVILPAYKELYRAADCWFEMNEQYFETRKGKTVTHLNFKIMTASTRADEDKKIAYIILLLRTHFQFKDADIQTIRPVLYNQAICKQEIQSKIIQLHQQSTDRFFDQR